MKALALGLAVALLGGARLRAQPPVRIAHDLPPRVIERVAAELAGFTVAWQSVAPDELEGRLRESPAFADVVFGVDGLQLAKLAAAGLLPERRSADYAPLEAPFRGAGDAFAVPLFAPIVFAYDVQAWGDAQPPTDWDDLLFEPVCDGRLLLGTPDAQPALWIGLFGWRSRQGGGFEQVLAWLRTLDARSPQYAQTRAELRARWGSGARDLALLESFELDPPRVAYRIPTSGTAARGLGLALLATDAAAVAVHAHLASPVFARAMCAVELVPAPRTDLVRDDLPAATQALGARLWPYDLAVDPQPWFTAWSRDVRGSGERAETIEGWLDLGLGLLFAGFLVLVYRHLQREEGGNSA